MNSRARKKDFPLLNRHRRLVYLDSAATTQKPTAVITAVKNWYEQLNSNVHRSSYQLAEAATASYEQARQTIADFIGAKTPQTVAFTKNATESINLVAAGWARWQLKVGDTILITEMEHHSNIVPWQLLAKEKKLQIRWWPVTKDGQLTTMDKKLFAGVKLVCVTEVSNVLGTINNIKKIVSYAHRHGAAVLVDAAQSAAHLPINVSDSKADFLVCSGHKMFGPTGIGVLYVAPEKISQFKPVFSGGEMITSVEKKASRFKKYPYLLEAGTQHLAGAYGLAAAVNYLKHQKLATIKKYNHRLTTLLYLELKKINGVTVYGPTAIKRCGSVSFSVAGIHPHDLAAWLDQRGIAARAGNHCAEILHQVLGVPATVRLSVQIYNTPNDIYFATKTLRDIISQWQRSTAKK